MLQGKVAKDRTGSTDWKEGELVRLCTGTDNPANTVACFTSTLQKTGDLNRVMETCSWLKAWGRQTQIQTEQLTRLQSAQQEITGIEKELAALGSKKLLGIL